VITRLYLPATPQTWLSMDYTRSVKHLVCYFSGTGNTQNAAGHIAAALEKQGHGTSLLQIEDPRGGDAPVRGRMRHPGASVPRLLMGAAGGDGFAAAHRARRALERRGYSVFLSDRVGYPDNWTQMMEPPDAQEAEAEIEAGTAAARRIGADIADRREQHYRPRGLGPFLLAAIGVIFRVFGRRLLGQFYAACAQCTTCRLCERTCPVAAISIPAGAHARPGWNSRCESCNRCINICPEGAIVTSPGRIILVPV
jgi:ferredoxin